MIKSSFKTIAKNWKYIFVPMGILYLGVIISLFSGISSISTAIKKVSNQSATQLTELYDDRIENQKVSKILDKEYLADFAKDAWEIVETSGTSLKSSLLAIAITAFSIILLFAVLSFYMTRSMIRSSISTEGKISGIVAAIFRSLLDIAFVALAGHLAFLWKWSLILTSIAGLIWIAFENLFCTWYIYFKEYKFTDIFNLKNAMWLTLATIITSGTIIGIVLLSLSFLSFTLALLIAIPLAIYTLACMDVVSVEHFKKQAREHLIIER